MRIDPSEYTIITKKVSEDGESFFQCSVKEFPDVTTYGETYSEAYELALETITGLQDLSLKLRKTFPSPLPQETDEYSGRITLRMTKSLHAYVSNRAEMEGVSINQYIVTTLAIDVNNINLTPDLRMLHSDAPLIGITSMTTGHLKYGRGSIGVISSTLAQLQENEVTETLENNIFNEGATLELTLDMDQDLRKVN